MADTQKREVVLLPGQAVFVRTEKGNLKTYTGPYKWDLGTYDALVIWDRNRHTFIEVPIEQKERAFQQATVVPEGYYAVLTNPAKNLDKEEHPGVGCGNDTVDLRVGEKVNIQGPTMFHLWPGQTVDLIRGHHLSRNEFVRIKVYDPSKAKANWTKAAVATEVAQPADSAKTVGQTPSLFAAPPSDLAMGKQYNVRGDEVSFYMPPTGVSVVASSEPNSRDRFVRQAVTLQLLQYCILEDESGQKRYVRGPDVVFPEPTEEFREDNTGSTAFRALELNEIQRIHLKFSKDVVIEVFEGGQKVKKEYKAGDEASFTGAQMPIYYPEEGHQLVTYDGKLVHYAVQVSEGEGRYVLERMTGRVNTVFGPAMLLPDPTKEVIVLRPLTDKQVMDWFPGPNGTGSEEALEWNRKLRGRANAEPTTRQGTVSAGRAGQMDAMEAMYLNSAPIAVAAGSSTRSARKSAGGFEGDMSRQGKNQRLEGDETERSSTFHSPRTVVLFGKFQGPPLIDLYPGYAVSLVHSDGTRETVEGPKKRLLGFGDNLDTLQASTGKPKSTDRLIRITYLQTKQNRVSDIVEVLTRDNVKLFVKLSYIVNFEGENSKWFAISNFVKHLCDRAKSILKATVRKMPAKVFYAAGADIVRDTILGVAKEGQERPGMVFPENGMRVVDVDILAVEMTDNAIKALFDKAMTDTVVNDLELERSNAHLALFKAQQENVRNLEEERVKTAAFLHDNALQEETRIRALLKEQADTQADRDENAIEALQARIARDDKAFQQALGMDAAKQHLRLELLKEETAATVARFDAVAPGFTEALLAVKDADTMVKVSQALSAQMLFGGQNVAEVLKKVVVGTPFEAFLNRALDSAARALPAVSSNGAGQPRA